MYPNWASQMVLVVKNLPANARDSGSIPELGGGNANLLQYSYLKNLRDRVTKSRTRMQQLSMYTCTHPNYISDSNLTIQFSSVAQSCPTLCDPMNFSTPGLPVHHQLPESTQPHVHRVGDAIQPSPPLSSPSPPALNLSQHQGLFK